MPNIDALDFKRILPCPNKAIIQFKHLLGFCVYWFAFFQWRFLLFSLCVRGALRDATQFIRWPISTKYGQKFLTISKIGEIRERKESGQNVGHCDGCVYCVLASIFCRQFTIRILHTMYWARGNCIGSGHMAWMDQFQYESRHLCVLESRL